MSVYHYQNTHHNVLTWILITCFVPAITFFFLPRCFILRLCLIFTVTKQSWCFEIFQTYFFIVSLLLRRLNYSVRCHAYCTVSHVIFLVPTLFICFHDCFLSKRRQYVSESMVSHHPRQLFLEQVTFACNGTPTKLPLQSDKNVAPSHVHCASTSRNNLLHVRFSTSILLYGNCLIFC